MKTEFCRYCQQPKSRTFMRRPPVLDAILSRLATMHDDELREVYRLILRNDARSVLRMVRTTLNYDDAFMASLANEMRTSIGQRVSETELTPP